MLKHDSLEEVLSRNRAFVKREEVDRPLIGIEIRPELAKSLQRFRRIAKALPCRGLVFPEMIKTEDFLKDVDELVLQHEQIGGDIIWAASPPREVPWMQAIIGCSLHTISYSIWATPFPLHCKKMQEIDLSRDNKWWQKLIELQTALVEHAKGRYPIATSTSMSGPGDMLVVTLGPERLGLELYDNLQKVKNLASAYTIAWIKVVKAQHKLVPKFHGGYLPASYTIWTPGMSQLMLGDSLAFFSPKFYKAVLLEHHRAMSSTAEYCLIHLHPICLYGVKELVNIKNLSVIEVNREAMGPSIEELFPSLKKIQEQKGLVIAWHGVPTKVPLEAEIRYVLKHLSPRGLCLFFMVNDVEEGKSIMNRVRKVFRDYKNRNKR